jgi:hypothetical protein
VAQEATPFDNPRGGNTAVAETPVKKTGGLASVGEGGEIKASTRKRDPFARPSGGGGDYKMADFIDGNKPGDTGELLLIQPVEVDSMITSASKKDEETGALLPSEFVRVNVIRLENDNERADDLLVFWESLRRELKKVLHGPNNWVLGRLAVGSKKPGKNAPYILEQPTEDEYQHAFEVGKQLGLDF